MQGSPVVASNYIKDTQFRRSYDAAEEVLKVAMLRWDSGTLSWAKYTGVAPGGLAADVSVISTVGLTDAELRAAAIDVILPVYATRIDEASASVTYIGKALPGTSGATAAWRIFRITVTGGLTVIEYADGDDDFDNVWDDRAGLSYS